MPRFQAPRGARDILPDEQPYWAFVRAQAEEQCRRFGFRRVDTPTFEETGLFRRGVGEGTDIVDKEMYTFEDKGRNSLTLRPEGTAPVVRAYLEHGMQVWPQPVKLYYLPPIFRYDRPQAGRYREHHQFGVEALGELDPAVDAEVIYLASRFYRAVGIQGLSLQINSIGCPNCRPSYIAELTRYYRDHAAHLCADCTSRLERNPLRLLDCKVNTCRPMIEAAPSSADYLCEECRTHFASLRRYLGRLGLEYNVNARLVRGLDYYTKTVFEFWGRREGAQNALGGGGRYDGLAETLGGPHTPGIGFGIGLERAILTMQAEGITVPDTGALDVFVVYMGAAAREAAVLLLADLRGAGLAAASAFGERSMRAQLRQANTQGARYAAIIGDDELAAGTVTLRSLKEQGQETLPRADLAARLGAGATPDVV